MPEAIGAMDEVWGGREVPSRPRLFAKRAWFETKTLVARYPAIALPIARRRHGTVVDDRTQLVIEAFPRSGMTFAVVAFEMAQPHEIRVACHVHAPAQVIAATRRHIPALVLVREPEPTILSFVVRHPHVTMPQALRAYFRFYAPLLRHRDAFIVGSFGDVTADLGAVIRRVNARFGTAFEEFDHTPENVDRCFATISEAYGSRVRTDAELERSVARPSPERERIKQLLRQRYREPTLADARDRAESVHAAMIRPITDEGP